MLCQTVVVSIWSLFEHNMITMAQHEVIRTTASQEEGQKKANKMRDLAEIKNFWEKRGIQFPAGWDELMEIREVRNIIVHDGARRHVVMPNLAIRWN